MRGDYFPTRYFVHEIVTTHGYNFFAFL